MISSSYLRPKRTAVTKYAIQESLIRICDPGPPFGGKTLNNYQTSSNNKVPGLLLWLQYTLYFFSIQNCHRRAPKKLCLIRRLHPSWWPRCTETLFLPRRFPLRGTDKMPLARSQVNKVGGSSTAPRDSPELFWDLGDDFVPHPRMTFSFNRRPVTKHCK